MSDGTTMRTVGVDVGSSAIKVVILEQNEGEDPNVLVAVRERIRRRDPQVVATQLFERCVGDAGLERGELDYVATTGEGELCDFRTGHFYGMTTHAR
ncbi:MAG: benzoyl-CoA reductase subunit D, partial [Planctomycetota bacterium]